MASRDDFMALGTPAALASVLGAVRPSVPAAPGTEILNVVVVRAMPPGPSSRYAFNCYLDTTNTWRYLEDGPGAVFSVDGASGAFYWFTAPSGVAGELINLTYQMGLFPGGYLTLPRIPTSDPLVAGALWSNGGAITLSAG